MKYFHLAHSLSKRRRTRGGERAAAKLHERLDRVRRGAAREAQLEDPGGLPGNRDLELHAVRDLDFPRIPFEHGAGKLPYAVPAGVS